MAGVHRAQCELTISGSMPEAEWPPAVALDALAESVDALAAANALVAVLALLDPPSAACDARWPVGEPGT